MQLQITETKKIKTIQHFILFLKPPPWLRPWSLPLLMMSQDEIDSGILK